MNNTLLTIVMVGCLALASLFGSDDRPVVYFAVTRLADEDTKEDTWIAMGRKPPMADHAPNCWYWYPRYGKGFFAVVTPVTVSDFAIFGVRFNWDVKDADARHRNLQYVEAKWDTPTPFTGWTDLTPSTSSRSPMRCICESLVDLLYNPQVIGRQIRCSNSARDV